MGRQREDWMKERRWGPNKCGLEGSYSWKIGNVGIIEQDRLDHINLTPVAVEASLRLF